jgi:hypothetical protein
LQNDRSIQRLQDEIGEKRRDLSKGLYNPPISLGLRLAQSQQKWSKVSGIFSEIPVVLNVPSLPNPSGVGRIVELMHLALLHQPKDELRRAVTLLCGVNQLRFAVSCSEHDPIGCGHPP